MSKKLPWYKRDVDAWRSGTRGMSLELRGFYNELLDEMWDHQGPVPFHVKRIAMATCCNARKVRQLLPQLIDLSKIVETPEGLINRRMADEISTSKNCETSSKIRETSSKVSKKPTFSTRVLEEEKEEDSKSKFDFEKSEVERVRREAADYERQLAEAEKGTVQ